MTSQASDGGSGPYFVAAVLLTFAAYLTIAVIPGAESPSLWALLTVDLVALVGGVVTAIPSLREPVLRLVSGSLVRWGPDGGEIKIGGAPGATADLPQPQERAPEVAPQERSEAKRLPRGEALAAQPDDILKTAYIHVSEGTAEALDRACATLEAGLKRFPDDPQLLVAFGYVQQRLDHLNEAITATERAYAVLSRKTDRTPQEEEKRWVAASNLCYQLALRANPGDRERALTIGADAAQRADEFEDRDSFQINYGFARLTFAADEDERIGALVYLCRVMQRPLTREEQFEVLNYIVRGGNRVLDAETVQLTDPSQDENGKDDRRSRSDDA